MKIRSKSKIGPTGILFLLLILIIPLCFDGCKDFGVPDWTLNVTLGDGVGGTPAAGIYQYQELTLIEYNYYPLENQYPVEVLVNGNRWNLAGEFVIYNDMTVVAQLFDIRDTWVMSYKETGATTSAEFNITFTGSTILSGTFTDDRGYNGTWAIADKKLTATFSNWSNYIFTGTAAEMSGDWTGDGKTGTWSAYRKEE